MRLTIGCPSIFFFMFLFTFKTKCRLYSSHICLKRIYFVYAQRTDAECISRFLSRLSTCSHVLPLVSCYNKNFVFIIAQLPLCLDGTRRGTPKSLFCCSHAYNLYMVDCQPLLLMSLCLLLSTVLRKSMS